MIKKISFLLIGFVLTLLLGIIILEVLFGGWLKSQSGWHVADKIGITRNQKISFDNAETYGKQYLNHKDRFGNSSWNKYGFRGTCRSQKAQIVVLGGSTTMNPTTSDDKVWTEVLQSQLRLNLKNQNICVMNAGVNGQTTYGHIASLEKWFPLVPNFTPQIYIIYTGINDAGFEAESVINWEPGKLELSNFDNLIKWVKWNSATYRVLKLINYTWKRYAPAEKRAYTTINVEAPITELNYFATDRSPNTEKLISRNKLIFERNLERIFKNIKVKGAKIICVSQPHQLARIFNEKKKGIFDAGRYSGININGIDFDASLRELNSVMKQKCSGENSHYINLTDKEFPIDNYWDYVHMTPVGQNALANYIANQLFAMQDVSSILTKY